MKSLLATIASLLMLAAASTAKAQPFAYITNQSSGTVSVINTATNSVVGTVVVGTFPTGVAINPSGTRAYVANNGSNSVSVINTALSSIISTVGVGTGPTGVAVNPVLPRAYVANFSGATVSVIDTASNSVVAAVMVGSNPENVAVNPAGTRVYVTNRISQSVSVIDTATNTVVATVALSANPNGIAVNPAGTRAYVLNGGNATVIDTSGNTVLSNFTVGTSAEKIAFNPAGTVAYATVPNINSVAVIDISSNTVTATVPVGMQPNGVALNAAGTRAYVTNESGNDVSVIDTASNMVIASVGVGVTPIGVAVNPTANPIAPGAPMIGTAVAGNGSATVNYTPPAFNGGSIVFNYTATSNPGGIQGSSTGGPIIVSGLTNGTAYTFTVTATNTVGSSPPSAASNSVTPTAPPPTFAYITNLASNNVSVINFSTNTVIATIPVGGNPQGVAVNSAGTRAYITNGTGNSVSVIDTSINSVIATVPVGASPNSVAVKPSGNAAYVSNFSSNSVSVIDTSSNTVVATIPVGMAPNSVAVLPAGTRVYVSNQNSQNVSVINTATSTVIATIPIGGVASGLVVHPNGSRVYVVSPGVSSNIISTIDTATNTVVNTFSSGTTANNDTQFLSVNNAGTRIYAANQNTNSVTVVDSTNGSLIATVPVGTSPHGVAFNPAGNRAYVANRFTNNVSVIDTTTNTVVASIPVGTEPFATGIFIQPTFGPLNPPSITSPAPAGANVGAAYSHTFTASGTAPFDWSIASGTLPAGLVLNNQTGALAGTPTATGSFVFTVQAFNGVMPNATQGVTLVVAPAPAPAVTVTGSTMFPATTVGSSSAVQAITITNSGTATLTLSLITASNVNIFFDTTSGPAPNAAHWCGFGSVTGGAPSTGSPINIAPGNSCVINSVFRPNAVGGLSSSIIINSNAASSPTTITLTGSGAPPSATHAPGGGLNFGNVVQGVTSASQQGTFTNTSGTVLSVSGISFTGGGAGFNVLASSQCLTTPMLVSMASCTFDITATPNALGTLSDTVRVNTTPANAATPVALSLTVNGISAATPSMTVGFAPTTVTPGANASMTLTLTNPNPTPAGIGGGSITIPAGLTATPPVTNPCGTFGSVSAGVYSFGMGSVPGSGSCTIVLTVQSPTPGMYTANIAPGALNAGGNNTNSSSATLTVSALLPPTISFAVVPTSIIVGGTSVGTLTINNPNAIPLTANPILFNYLPGLVNAPAPNASSTCVGASITATPGASSYTQNTTFTLPPSGSCTFSATITSGTAGTYAGNIAAGLIVTPAGSSNATPFAITVTAAPTAGVSLAPPTVNFGARTVNTTSPPTAVTLTNSGTANLIITGITGSGDFGFTSTCPISTPPVIPAGTCTINITFTPLTAAALSGAITIVSNAPGSPHSVALSGTGSAAAVPGISLSPTALSFGAQAINTSSFIQTVTVTNTGFANLTISGISVAAPFNRAPLGIVTPPDCGATVAPGSSCQIGITFSPTAVGAQTGQISIIDNAAGSPHTVPLSGTGTTIPVPMISISGTVNFGDQIVNAASSALNLTISNSGAAMLNVSAITLTGINATNFAFTGQSGCTTIAPAASCTLAVTFSTTSLGAKAAQINITSNAQNTPVTTVSLSGNGILAPRPVVNLSATVVGYGNVIFGGATPSQTITLTNSGGQAMAIPNMLVTGDFVQVNNCGTSLASLASCNISILFTPLGQGSRFGEFVLTTNAATSPDLIQLSGTGCRWFSQTQSRFFITNCGG